MAEEVTLQDWISVITLVVLAITAGAAIWLGFLNRDLVKQSIADVQEAREARYDQYRPILVYGPAVFSPEVKNVLGYAEQLYADLSVEKMPILLSNIGTGPALDVLAVLFGPTPRGPSEEQAHIYFKYSGPITSGGREGEIGHQGGLLISGDALVGREKKYTLYAPPRPSPKDPADGVTPYIVARLTITYHDIFGRKHASIFDYTSQEEWLSVDEGFFPSIPQDLKDLEREHTRRERPPAPSPQDLEVPAQ